MASFYTGNSGKSTGDHLDFRIFDVEKGGYVNPNGFTNIMSVGGKPLTDQFGITSAYGMREHPTDGGQKMHHGIDYGTPGGTKVDIDGTYLTTFNDAGGGITNQYAFERDGRKYEALLMHGNDQNTVLSDAAITNGLAVSKPTSDATPARAEAKTKAQDYKSMSKAQLDTEYDRLRAGKDVNAAKAAGLAMHKAHFNKP